MNKKYLYTVSIMLVFVLLGAVSVNAEEASSTEKSGRNASSTGETHRNRVFKVVQELEKVANRDRGVRDEVKTVAQEEKDTSERVKEKMDAVEKRSAFKTFLIGSDYRNLGALRSELVTTKNYIERLTKSLERSDSLATQNDLQTQINDLLEIQTKAENFIKSMDGKLSLFGWLTRMFNK